ncbi:conserved hypothetical protein [Burkholderia vietnamiensis]|nr:conserved hypothetical protein [Burkholderia vietnamiensis]SOT46066.1 hypothetical protein F01_570052 [Burkholderia cenocepacia]
MRARLPASTIDYPLQLSFQRGGNP